jgi:hypothetical protein|tara:strand:- start:672 stop:1910 length:1239 start_codon:yes stop_codon:yes gene_type:complete
VPSFTDLTHEEVLQKIHAEIDMPQDILDTIIDRYQSIGRWLDRDGSSISQYDPKVAAQGSVRLGTANRPIGENDEYDVDLICRLSLGKSEITQQQLKAEIGEEIKAYAAAQSMNNEPEDKRRCWTMEYADKRNFHVDILPCIPDAENYRKRLFDGGFKTLAERTNITEEAIAITDQKDPNYRSLSEDWPSSNPLGYAEWFKEKMAERLIAAKRALFESEAIYDSIEDIPDHKVKTTLQKSVQLLKRHRDYVFSDDGEHKPISILITTLAAQAYSNESTLVDALAAVLEKLDTFIEDRDGIVWVPNPVNPAENFADKWEEEPMKAKEFRRWLNLARRDFGEYINAMPPDRVPTALRDRLGENLVEKVIGSVAKAMVPAVVSSVTERASARTDGMVDRIRERGTGTQPWRDIEG